MAISAFRSTSKRGNVGASSTNISSARENTAEDLGNKIFHRRSRSVSALSRSYPATPSSSNVLNFSNKRDNPLFCESSPSPPDESKSKTVVGILNFAENGTKLDDSAPKSGSSSVSDSRRGRSVSRSSDEKNHFSGPRKEIGRSLSRVDTGRRHRSVSRGHYRNSESEVDNDYSSPASSRNKYKGNFVANGQDNSSELSKQTGSLQTWSSRHPLSEPSDGSALCVLDLNWEDAQSTCSYSEAEEKTIKAVFEQMKSLQSEHSADALPSGGIYETVRSEVRRAVSEIRNDLEYAFERKNPAIISTANITDVPPELVNPDAIELVSDIRREYATKFEQSQERARKLRADLAIEEQRGQELSKILRETLPDPKNSEMQISRARRKNSIERRKMSRRLTEEALNYFDECVSISTFDSSDFSAPEDPPFCSAVATPEGGDRMFPCKSSSASATYCSDNHLNDNKDSNDQAQRSIMHEDFNLTARGISKDTNEMHKNFNQDLSGSSTECGNPSFAPNLVETDGFIDVRTFARKFEKELPRDGLEMKRSSYNFEDYCLSSSAESLLFDKVIFKNRIKSGGLLLCHVRVT